MSNLRTASKTKKKKRKKRTKTVGEPSSDSEVAPRGAAPCEPVGARGGRLPFCGLVRACWHFQMELPCPALFAACAFLFGSRMDRLSPVIAGELPAPLRPSCELVDIQNLKEIIHKNTKSHPREKKGNLFLYSQRCSRQTCLVAIFFLDFLQLPPLSSRRLNVCQSATIIIPCHNSMSDWQYACQRTLRLGETCLLCLGRGEP